MRTPARILLIALGLGAVVAVAAASVSAAPSVRPTAHVQSLALTITGSRMQEHVSPSSGNFALAPGVPVRMTVTNYTSEYHTFTIPGLHVSELIFPARDATPRKTTFTFTANQSGTFAWYCAFCEGGFHGPRHVMGGEAFVIIDPSDLP